MKFSIILGVIATGLLMPLPALADSTMTNKTTLSGRAFEYRVAGYHICLKFQGEGRLKWTYLDAPNGETGKSAIETFDRRDLRSELVMLSWTEASGANVTDVFDFSEKAVHASFVTPQGQRFTSDADIAEQSGCGPDHSARAGPVTNREVAQALYAAFRSHDISALEAIMAKDLVNHPAAPGSAPGWAGMKTALAHFFEAVPDFNIEVQDIVTGDGKTVVRSIARGTPKAGLFGFPTNGGSFEIATTDVLAIRDGRISEIWHLENWFGALRQLEAIRPGS